MEKCFTVAVTESTSWILRNQFAHQGYTRLKENCMEKSTKPRCVCTPRQRFPHTHSMFIPLQIFDCPRLKFSEIPQRLTNLLLPPDPIVINHVIRYVLFFKTLLFNEESPIEIKFKFDVQRCMKRVLSACWVHLWILCQVVFMLLLGPLWENITFEQDIPLK